MYNTHVGGADLLDADAGGADIQLGSEQQSHCYNGRLVLCVVDKWTVIVFGGLTFGHFP
jgi:hypothetical protein